MTINNSAQKQEISAINDGLNAIKEAPKIDFPNVDKNAKIVVAMSGGVDSSTTVALLQEAGYTNVIGMTLLLYENDDEKGIVCRDQTIIDDCNQVAKHLGIEHHFIELKEEFMDTIINPFLQGYANGITVNPCISCNRDIKYGALLRESKKIGADVLVTGHYIKWEAGESGLGEIHKGQSVNRDQSYFLSMVRKEAISYMRFPLANFTKDITRQHAKRFGLHVADKKASIDLCFAAGSSYADIFKKQMQNQVPGNLIDTKGNILGQHQGIHHFTVGQRKGVGLSSNNGALFVVKIIKETNQVVLGTREDLAVKEINLHNCNWLGDEDFKFESKQILAKVRGTQILIPATIYPLDNGKAKIVFNEDIFAVASGQVCAFYDGNRLLGGGYI
jgi:tRNA-specific 2-thiouridylase